MQTLVEEKVVNKGTTKSHARAVGGKIALCGDFSKVSAKSIVNTSQALRIVTCPECLMKLESY